VAEEIKNILRTTESMIEFGACPSRPLPSRFVRSAEGRLAESDEIEMADDRAMGSEFRRWLRLSLFDPDSERHRSS
jgi:hypothetical protein